jgi:transcriptional regulator with XRE-family HTH domain
VAASAEREHVAARHQLGVELRQLREKAGLSGQALASQLGWSQSKVSRIEQARTYTTVDDVLTMIDALTAPTTVRRRVRKLAEQAASGVWRNSTRVGLTRRQQDFIDLESTATGICHYNPVLLPGYMQTEEYAHQVLEMAGAVDIPRRLEYRRARRATMLRGSRPTYRIVLLETALHWRPLTPSQMRAQLEALAEFAELPNVDLRVVPLDQTQTTYIQHPMMIFQFEQTPARALVETEIQDHHVTDALAVKTLQRRFERLSSSALSRSGSLALVRTVSYAVANKQ